MKYYVFEPLMEGGKQVVRRPEDDDWFDMGGELIFNEGRYLAEYPIVSLRTYDEDPIKEIREAHKDLEDFMNSPIKKSMINMKMWRSISTVVKKWEEKK